jgi:hypothetical protein
MYTLMLCRNQDESFFLLRPTVSGFDTLIAEACFDLLTPKGKSAVRWIVADDLPLASESTLFLTDKISAWDIGANVLNLVPADFVESVYGPVVAKRYVGIMGDNNEYILVRREDMVVSSKRIVCYRNNRIGGYDLRYSRDNTEIKFPRSVRLRMFGGNHAHPYEGIPAIQSRLNQLDNDVEALIAESIVETTMSICDPSSLGLKTELFGPGRKYAFTSLGV